MWYGIQGPVACTCFLMIPVGYCWLLAVPALSVLRVVSSDLMAATVADELITNKAHPCVTWSKKEALDRCVNVETWTKDIPAVV